MPLAVCGLCGCKSTPHVVMHGRYSPDVNSIISEALEECLLYLMALQVRAADPERHTPRHGGYTLDVVQMQIYIPLKPGRHVL
jgi:hypothetical protein